MVVMLCFSLLPSMAAASTPSDITVYIDFEGYNLGQGLYIAPTKMTVPANWTAGQVTVALLNQTNHEFDAGVNEDGLGEEFYLSSVKGFDTGAVNFPSYITEITNENNDGNDDAWLGQFDYSSSSGWMLFVDHFIINQGAGNWQLNNGSVIRWQFTVQGSGADLGLAPEGELFGDAPLYPAANKDALVRAIADNPLPALSAMSAEDDFIEARADAIAALINPLASQDDVDGAVEALEEAAEALNAGEPVDVKVTVQMDDSGFYLAKTPLNVEANLSETYGYADQFNGAQATALDALVAAHILIFGTEDLDDYLAITTAYGTSFATKEFGQPGGSYLFYINGQQPNDGNYQPDTYNGGTAATGYSLVEAPIADSDDILFTVLQDTTFYMDMYVWFEYEDVKVDTLTVTAGEDFDLALIGYMNWYGYSDPTFQASQTAGIEDAQLVLVEIDDEYDWAVGTFDDLAAALTDEDGVTTLNFETAGTYIISAYDTSGDYPLIAPWLEITVEAPAVDNKADLNALISYADGLDLNGYTSSTWNAMITKLNAAKAVSANADATEGQIETVKNELQDKLNALIPTSTTIKVTSGATVGLYQKGGNHYAAFTSFPLVKDDAQSDGYYDAYTASGLPRSGGTFHVEAYIPGVTTKVAKIASYTNAYGKTLTVDLTPLTQWTPVDNTYMNAGLYTNLGDSGAVQLATGGEFYLDTFRVWQAMEGVTTNYFIEPYYTFELSGSSVGIERVGTPGRERLKITALQPGVSVIKVTYDPVEYISGNTNLKFNAIAPHNTGAVVVSVDGGADFNTGITLRNDFDTVYFDNTTNYALFTFTPAAGTSVRVHDPLNLKNWGEGWEAYADNADGSFTIELKSGRNIVELTNGDSVKYYVIKAKGVDVTVTNETDPGEPFKTGDTAQISILGLETPIEKMGGIYNPGYGPTNQPYIRYTNGSANFDSGKNGQYNTLTSTYTVTYTVENTDLNVLTGQMYCGVIYGAGFSLGSHRGLSLSGTGASVGGGKPSSSVLWFGALPKIVLPIAPAPNYADSDYEEKLESLLDYLSESVPSPGFDTSGGEWTVLSLARGGADVPDGYYDGYLQVIGNKLDGLSESSTPYAVGYTVNPDTGKREVKLDINKITENERLVMALSSLGIDATNFKTATATYDLIARFSDAKGESTQKWWAESQGNNGPIWALLALNTRGWDNPYEIPASRNTGDYTTTTPVTVENLIDWILGKEAKKGTEDAGGWPWSTTEADTDMTGMALQALAPYYHVPNEAGSLSTDYKYPDVDAAIDRAIVKLSEMQDESGGYLSWGAINTESIAQVVMGLTALGIDPVTDARFQKTDSEGVINNPISAMLTFYVPETGGFAHTLGGSTNGMACDQAGYALVSYDRFVKGLNAMYNMHDSEWVDKSELEAAIASAKAAYAAQGGYTDASWEAYEASLASAIQATYSTSLYTQAEIGTVIGALSEAISDLAIETNAYVFTLGADSEVKAGEELSVKLKLSSESESVAGWWSAWVEYDADVLEYTGVTPEAAEFDTATAGVVKLVKLGTADDINTTGAGTVVAELTFTVKSGATAASTEISVNPLKAEAGKVAEDPHGNSTAALAGSPAVVTIVYEYGIQLPAEATDIGGVDSLNGTTNAGTAVKGRDVTFKLPDAGGDNEYTVTYSVDGGAETEITPNSSGVYTIPGAAVTGEITVSAVKTAKGTVRLISEEEFRGIPADKQVMVFVPAVRDESKTYLFEGEAMYWSSKYEGGSFVYIIDAELTGVQAKALITTGTSGTNVSISYSGDVNGDGEFKVQDAQLAYSLYNGKYDSESTRGLVSDLDRLRADINGDGTVDTQDARAIQVIALS
jgi:hypothetical protein